MIVDHRFHIRPRLVDAAMDRPLDIDFAAALVDRLAVEIEFEEIVACHQLRAARAREEEAVGLGRMAHADMAIGIDHVLMGEDAVRHHQIVQDFVEIAHFGVPPLRCRYLARKDGGGNHYPARAVVPRIVSLTRRTMKPFRAALYFAALLAIAPTTGRAAEPTTEVLTYHADAARSGNFVVPGLTFDRARAAHLDGGFKAQIDGHVYAQPLFWRGGGGNGLVLVATESNNVYALDGASGKTVWQRALGR